MKYGNATLSGRFVLGPMAAYTDIAFRLLCRKHGAAMCFTEFSNADSLVRNVARSWELARTCAKEMPVGIQIFGSSADAISRAAGMISQKAASGELFASCIDLNFGCPSGSVIRAGAGSALLRKPEKMGEIARACVKASEIPVTAKIRAGWSSDNAAAMAKVLEDAGVSGLCVHWRTATEGRKRSSGWGVLAEVKGAVGIPLIGNGGASSPEKAVRILSETGCDAVMISSAALGNPGIFSSASALLGGRSAPEPDWGEKLGQFREYAALAGDFGLLSPKRLRLHAQEFLSGIPGASAARRRLNSAKTEGDILSLMENFRPMQAIPALGT